MKRKKRLLLVYPKNEMIDFGDLEYIGRFLGKPGGMLNASLATVAAMTPEDFEVQIVDEAVNQIDFDAPYDLVGITGFRSHVSRAEQIAAAFSQRSIPVVCGGPSVSISPERWRSFADVLIIGEAEDIWPEFVRDFLNGDYRHEYRERVKPDLSRTPIPDYSGFGAEKFDKYVAGIVQTSRGCPFSCEFCDAIVYVGRKMRYKPIDQIMSEVEQLQRMGIRIIFLADDNFSAGRQQSKEILKTLREWNHRQRHPIEFSTELSIETSNDDEFLRLAAEAGLTQIYVGLETPSEEALAEVHKLQNVRNNMLEGVRRFHEHGIMVMAGAMVGFDHDDVSIFRRQLQFFQDAGIPKTSVHIVYAPDGTPLKERIQGEGRYLDPYDKGTDKSRYRNPVANLTIIPKRMTVNQLQQGAYWLLWELNKAANQAERLRVFFENYERSPLRGKLSIPRTDLPRDRRGLQLRWKLLNYYLQLSAEDRRGFHRTLRYAWRSSHPQRITLAVKSFIHSQVFKATVLQHQPDAPRIACPESTGREEQQQLERNGQTVVCKWDRDHRLTEIVTRDRTGRTVNRRGFDPAAAEPAGAGCGQSREADGATLHHIGDATGPR